MHFFENAFWIDLQHDFASSYLHASTSPPWIPHLSMHQNRKTDTTSIRRVPILMKLMNYRFFHLHTKKLCPRISRMPRPLNASLNSRSVYVYLYVSASDLWYLHEPSHHIRHSFLSSVPHSLSFIIMLPATDSCWTPNPPISLSPLDASGAGRRSIVGARRLLFQSRYFLYIFPPDSICCFRL